MELIQLSCLLMDNNEVMFKGRSLGIITEEEKKKFATTQDDFDEIQEKAWKYDQLNK